MSLKKDTNPKDALGTSKLPLDNLPLPFMAETSLVLLSGALKYGAWNWRATGVRLSVYIAAAMRHLMALKEGQWLDPESGRPHAAHVSACMAIVLDADKMGKLERDHPEGQLHLEELMAEYSRMTGELIDRYTQLDAKTMPPGFAEAVQNVGPLDIPEEWSQLISDAQIDHEAVPTQALVDLMHKVPLWEQPRVDDEEYFRVDPEKFREIALEAAKKQIRVCGNTTKTPIGMSKHGRISVCDCRKKVEEGAYLPCVTAEQRAALDLEELEWRK